MGASRIKINLRRGESVKIDGKNHIYINDFRAIFRLKFEDYYTDSTILESFIKQGYQFVYDRTEEKDIELNEENLLKQDIEGYDYVVLVYQFDKNNVSEFFRYRVSIQIKGIHIIQFEPLTRIHDVLDRNTITFIGYDGHPDGIFGKYGDKMDELFGPRYKCENWQLSDFCRYPWEYRQPITAIEKIFLTKEFYDPSYIGTKSVYHLTGEKEILELDLRNPDMDIYRQMNAIEQCVEIEWE